MNKHILSKIGFLLLLIIIISICAVSKTTSYESFTDINLQEFHICQSVLEEILFRQYLF